MNIRDIPRGVVHAGLQAARLPLTAVERVARRDQAATQWPPAVAFDAFEATVKQAAGTILRDPKLLAEARLEQAKVAELERAGELEAEATHREQEAAAALDKRLAQDEARRADANQRIEAQAEAARQDAATRKRQADQAARSREEAARKLEAKQAAAIDAQERAATRQALDAERAALATERKAITAKTKVAKIDQKLDRSKAARKAR
jgi:hypothetical protein